MKKFILKIFLFSLIVFAIFCGWFFYLNSRMTQSDAYLLAFENKINHLKSTDNQNRIILVGGSNIAFGVNSKAISDSLKIPVINYGLHAGLGLALPLAILNNHLHSGDIVVCMPEHDMFYGTSYYGGESTLPSFLIAFPQYLAVTDFRHIQVFFKGFKRCSNEIAFSKNDDTRKSDQFIYTSIGFNDAGDEVSHLVFPTQKIRTQIIDTEFSENVFDNFNDILENWRSKGIKIFVLPPCIHKQHYFDNKEKIDYLTKRFMLLYPEYNRSFILTLFEDNEMFNTVYHLNKKGRERNTQRLLNFLDSIK